MQQKLYLYVFVFMNPQTFSSADFCDVYICVETEPLTMQ